MPSRTREESEQVLQDCVSWAGDSWGGIMKVERVDQALPCCNARMVYKISQGRPGDSVVYAGFYNDGPVISLATYPLHPDLMYRQLNGTYAAQLPRTGTPAGVVIQLDWPNTTSDHSPTGFFAIRRILRLAREQDVLGLYVPCPGMGAPMIKAVIRTLLGVDDGGVMTPPRQFEDMTWD